MPILGSETNKPVAVTDAERNRIITALSGYNPDVTVASKFDIGPCLDPAFALVWKLEGNIDKTKRRYGASVVTPDDYTKYTQPGAIKTADLNRSAKSIIREGQTLMRVPVAAMEARHAHVEAQANSAVDAGIRDALRAMQDTGTTPLQVDELGRPVRTKGGVNGMALTVPGMVLTAQEQATINAVLPQITQQFIQTLREQAAPSLPLNTSTTATATTAGGEN